MKHQEGKASDGTRMDWARQGPPLPTPVRGGGIFSFFMMVITMFTKTVNPYSYKLARAVVLGVLTLAAHQAQAVDYSFSDLGTVASASTYNFFVGGNNNLGQVVANRYSSDFSTGSAVVWSGGAWNPLDDYTGSSGTMSANAINDAGQVGGNSYDVPNDLALPIVWNGTTPTPLNRLNSESWMSSVSALNNNGQAAGGAWVASAGAFQGVRWDGVNIVDLPTLGGSGSAAWSINDSGQVVGRSNTTNDDAVHPVFWAADGSVTDLGTLGGAVDDTAWSINNNGQIVGHSYLADNVTYRPVLWNDSSSAPVDLGTLAGTSESIGITSNINNLGQIVGYSNFDDADHSQYAVTLWEGGEIINLSNFFPANLTADGWKMLPGVIDINDAGVVVGGLKNDGLGQYAIFQLTPTTVPVPGAVWLFGSALAGLIGATRRKQALAA